MCSLKIVLGLDPVQAIDPSALTTLAALCETLQVRTHLDQANSTFYVESPLAGKRLVVIPAPEGPLDTTALATDAADRTHTQLASAGAVVSVLPSGSPLPECDLAVRLSPGSLPTDGVSVTYNWMGHRENRKLAVYLAEEVAARAAMPNLGTRISLGGTRNRGVPVAQIATGLRPAKDEREHLATAVAAGIYQALARFWAAPVLAQIRAALAAMPAPAVTPGETPSPIEPPAAEPDPVAVPVLDLVPPNDAPSEVDEPVAHLTSYIEREPMLAWPPTDRILGIEPPAPDPVPAPVSAPMPEPEPAPEAPAEPLTAAHLLATSVATRIPGRLPPTGQPLVPFHRGDPWPNQNLHVFQRRGAYPTQLAVPDAGPPMAAAVPPVAGPAPKPVKKAEPAPARAQRPAVRIIESGGTLYHQFP